MYEAVVTFIVTIGSTDQPNVGSAQREILTARGVSVRFSVVFFGYFIPSNLQQKFGKMTR